MLFPAWGLYLAFYKKDDPGQKEPLMYGLKVWVKLSNSQGVLLRNVTAIDCFYGVVTVQSCYFDGEGAEYALQDIVKLEVWPETGWAEDDPGQIGDADVHQKEPPDSWGRP